MMINSQGISNQWCSVVYTGPGKFENLTWENLQIKMLIISPRKKNSILRLFSNNAVFRQTLTYEEQTLLQTDMQLKF